MKAACRKSVALVLSAACVGAVGCAPADPGAGLEPRPAACRQWVALFDGSGMANWRVLQGSAICRDGIMVLDGRRKDVTVLARGVSLKNGTVEVEVCRPAPADNAGPYTIGLRLPARINWRSTYFVCRPDSLEVCQASWRERFPKPEQSARFEGASGPVLWRFVMSDGRIDCYRRGKKVLSYADPNPCSGTIGLTASRCRVEVLSVRYLPDTGQP